MNKHRLELPPLELLARWFELFDEDHAHLVASGYFLIFGQELVDILQLPNPDGRLVEHARRVRDSEDAELYGILRSYLRESEAGLAVLLELAVDELLAAEPSSWEHPTQVLARPRPDYADLVPVCKNRGEHAARDETLRKLEKAAEIAASASRRREIMRRGRKRRTKPT